MIIRKIFVCVPILLVTGLWIVSTAVAGSQRTDFALLDMEPTIADRSVQCGATKASPNNPKPAAFTMHITMTNRSDLGGVNGFVRVKYADLDFVDYAIPAGTTVQISLAGGGTPGVDDVIGVTGVGGAILIGQASVILQADAKPHPSVSAISYCTTTNSVGVPAQPFPIP
jgi:hypothetical protein